MRHYFSADGVNGSHSEESGILVNVKHAMPIKDNSEYLGACKASFVIMIMFRAIKHNNSRYRMQRQIQFSAHKPYSSSIIKRMQPGKSIIPLISLLHLFSKRGHLAVLLIFSAILPRPVIPDAPDRLIHSNGAAGSYTQLSAVKSTLPEQCNTAERRVLAITGIIFLLTCAIIQRMEIDAMLQGTLFDELPFGDARVFADEAGSKTQGSYRRCARSIRGDFAGIRWEGKVCSAEDEDVADALFGAVLAFDCGGLVGYTTYQLS